MCIHIYVLLQSSDFWLRDLDLRYRDKAAVRANGGMLCDRHMHAANQLLSQQYPHLQGLHSTLFQSKEFPPLEMSGGFLPDGKNIANLIYIMEWKIHVVMHRVCRLYTISELDWWTGLVDWTTGLTFLPRKIGKIHYFDF